MFKLYPLDFFDCKIWGTTDISRLKRFKIILSIFYRRFSKSEHNWLVVNKGQNGAKTGIL